MNIRIPTPAEIQSDRSTVIGSFVYPERAAFGRGEDFDEGAWADAGAEVECEVRQEVLDLLNYEGIDTTDVEIRLSEMAPGEVRVVW